VKPLSGKMDIMKFCNSRSCGACETLRLRSPRGAYHGAESCTNCCRDGFGRRIRLVCASLHAPFFAKPGPTRPCSFVRERRDVGQQKLGPRAARNRLARSSELRWHGEIGLQIMSKLKIFPPAAGAGSAFPAGIRMANGIDTFANLSPDVRHLYYRRLMPHVRISCNGKEYQSMGNRLIRTILGSRYMYI
jgi:hypothetical protein